jgi:hypothetical protein
VSPHTISPIELTKAKLQLASHALSVSTLTIKLSAGHPSHLRERFISASVCPVHIILNSLLVLVALSHTTNSTVASMKLGNESLKTLSDSTKSSHAIYLNFVEATSTFQLGFSIVGAFPCQLLIRNLFIDAASNTIDVSFQLSSKYDIEFFVPNLFISGLTSIAPARSHHVTSHRGM